jgi:predicted RNA binding protein YcfA (HicA-like mRNA interferase family)
MPARYKRLRKALTKLGIKLIERPGKGSHVVFDDGRGHTYILPLSHGEKTELSDVYVRALCRAFEIEYADFVRLM